MTISDYTRLLLPSLRRAYPWVRYVSRDREKSGALTLHERQPVVTERGFVPTGVYEELPSGLLPEVPEGVMVRIETLLEADDG